MSSSSAQRAVDLMPPGAMVGESGRQIPAAGGEAKTPSPWTKDLQQREKHKKTREHTHPAAMMPVQMVHRDVQETQLDDKPDARLLRAYENVLHSPNLEALIDQWVQAQGGTQSQRLATDAMTVESGRQIPAVGGEAKTPSPWTKDLQQHEKHKKSRDRSASGKRCGKHSVKSMPAKAHCHKEWSPSLSPPPKRSPLLAVGRPPKIVSRRKFKKRLVSVPGQIDLTYTADS